MFDKINGISDVENIRKKKQDNRELMIHTKKKMECILFQFQNQLIIREIGETNSIYNNLMAKRFYIE